MAAPLDLIIIGAGPAGIAAGRAAMARGLSIQIVEARHRLGGRVLTRSFAGHAVDLGAHWLHAGPINPVVRLARSEGIRLRRAPQESHLLRDGRQLDARRKSAYGAAFARADGALNAASRLLTSASGHHGAAVVGRTDAPAAAFLPQLGPWRRPVAAISGLVCGRPLELVSAGDYASAEYADNHFAPDGFGAVMARLGRRLPVRLGVRATGIDWSGRGVVVETEAGALSARGCIVTVPPLVLQQGHLSFTPALPPETEAALHGFRAAIYEHVLLRWPGAPWQGRDRIATLTGRRIDGIGLLTCLDGSALHYIELDEPMACALRQPRGLRAGLEVRALLASQFGARAIRDLSVLHVSDWAGDALSLGSWSSVPPGLAHIRDALAQPVAGRLAFAGEMTDHSQWGTVGAAWGAGERAVDRLFPAV